MDKFKKKIAVNDASAPHIPHISKNISKLLKNAI